MSATPTSEDSPDDVSFKYYTACYEVLYFYIKQLEERSSTTKDDSWLPHSLVLALSEDKSSSRKMKPAACTNEEALSVLEYQELRENAKVTLQKLQHLDPHISMFHPTLKAKGDGMWLIKGCASSCGRGISIVGSIEDLVQEIRRRHGDCVVQKYIERPLLLQGMCV